MPLILTMPGLEIGLKYQVVIMRGLLRVVNMPEYALIMPKYI